MIRIKISVDLFQELTFNKNMNDDQNRLSKAELIEVEIKLDDQIMALEYNDDLSPFTEKLREAQSELNEYIDNMEGEIPIWMQKQEEKYQEFKRQMEN